MPGGRGGGIELFVFYLPLVVHVDCPPQDSAGVLFGRADIPIRRINVESGILCQTNKLYVLELSTDRSFKTRTLRELT